MSNPYLGQISMFAGNFAPAGWALCNGQLLQISDYDALYAVIGTTYGGDGQTTFALPNLIGRFPVHWGNASGLSPVVLGQSFGTDSVTLTSSTMPAHTHPLEATSAIPSTHLPSGALPATLPRSGPAVYAAAANLVNLNSAAVTTAGSGLPFDKVQPFLAVNFIMALEGIFPTSN